ncbi:MAG TPA: YjgP/YjgQ family permease, partial [Bacteroidales bacterium]|nr:YjgP/YjgQ family permease [Bacteroidales bacterium]
KSVAVVVTLVMVFAFMFSNFVLPIVNLNLGSLLYDISRKRPDLNITPGTFNNDIEGYTLNVGRKNFETNMLYNFVIYDHSKRNGNTSVTI